MTDYPDADRSWPGPLGNPYLTAAQRTQLAEDLILAGAAQLSRGDHSAAAAHLQEIAAGIRAQRETTGSPVQVGAMDVAALLDRQPFGIEWGQYVDGELVHDPRSRGPGFRRQHAADVDDRLIRHGRIPRSVSALARREWHRLGTGEAARARAELVAEAVRQQGYIEGYGTAYTTMASHVAAKATVAALQRPEASIALFPLVLAAGDAIADGFNIHQPAVPPPTNHLTEAIHAAAVSVAHEPWQPVAQTAWADGVATGAPHGSLTAANDVMIGWLDCGGDVLAGGLSIAGRPVRTWVNDLLASVNQQVAASFSRAKPTAAQLARLDQAPEAATAPAAASSTRTGGPRAATTRTTRTGRTR